MLVLSAVVSGAVSGAAARPMHVLDSNPAPAAIMDGRNEQYIVHFDGPVNHAQSRIEILRDGQVFAVLHPLLDSATDVLFASAPTLKLGEYVLRWSVTSIPDGDVSEGTIPFRVR